MVAENVIIRFSHNLKSDRFACRDARLYVGTLSPPTSSFTAFSFFLSSFPLNTQPTHLNVLKCFGVLGYIATENSKSCPWLTTIIKTTIVAYIVQNTLLSDSCDFTCGLHLVYSTRKKESAAADWRKQCGKNNYNYTVQQTMLSDLCCLLCGI